MQLPPNAADLAAAVDRSLLESAAAAAGSERALDEVLDWAAVNVRGAEMTRLNQRLSDPSQAQHAFAELQHRHRMAKAQGRATAAAAAGGFKSHEEYREAVAKQPALNADPEFLRRFAATPHQIIAGSGM